MDEKSLLEIREELDSIAIQLNLTDDFIQSFSFCLLETLDETLPPEKVRELKERFLDTLEQQQNQTLLDLAGTIAPATLDRNRFRVRQNIALLRKMYGLV